MSSLFEDLKEGLQQALEIAKNRGVEYGGYFVIDEVAQPKEAEVEIEGGWPEWWFVCGECHVQVSSMDIYCGTCGRRLDWSGVYLKAPGAERVPDDLRSAGAEREQEPGEP